MHALDCGNGRYRRPEGSPAGQPGAGQARPIGRHQLSVTADRAITEAPAAGVGPGRLTNFGDGALILLLGLAVRFGVVLASPGGPRGNFGYDSGVYYAAADALSFGRLPYADFVLLHPPGITVALAPFAALGRLTTDETGFVVANATFCVLGAINAVLVLLIAQRLGCTRLGALLGGAFYAVWYGTVNSELSIHLEPLSTAAFLTGLLLLAGRDEFSRRRTLAAGAAFSLACSVKIWWGVPLLVVLIWLLRRRAGRQPAAYFAGGAVLTALVLDGPFFAAAPRAMWRMVVHDQFARSGGTTWHQRLDDLTGVGAAFPGLTGPRHIALLAGFLLVVAAVTVAAWRRPPARLLAGLLLGQTVVLALSPDSFPAYASYPAGALAGLVAAAHSGERLPVRRLGAAASAVAVATVAALTAVTVFVRPITASGAFPSSRLAAAVAHLRCVTSDSPLALVELDALSRSLANGCPTYIDFTGLILDLDVPGERGLPMVEQAAWQARARAYLLSGDAVILVRPGGRLSPDTIAEIRRHPKLAEQGPHSVWDLRPSDAHQMVVTRPSA